MTYLRTYQREASKGVSYIGRAPDHSGKRFGMLLVCSLAHSSNTGSAQWLCLCDCGRTKIITANNLVRGKAKSCGCETVNFRAEKCRKHGQTRYKGKYSGAYSSWAAMKQRCENKNHKQWLDYGGRGITICKEWSDFQKFYADMGDRPEGMSLDRVDFNLGYSPDNCRWATAKMQTSNRRKKVKNRDVASLLAAVKSVINSKNCAEFDEVRALAWKYLDFNHGMGSC
jgi:hypothetical protein